MGLVFPQKPPSSRPGRPMPEPPAQASVSRSPSRAARLTEVRGHLNSAHHTWLRLSQLGMTPTRPAHCLCWLPSQALSGPRPGVATGLAALGWALRS